VLLKVCAGAEPRRRGVMVCALHRNAVRLPVQEEVMPADRSPRLWSTVIAVILTFAAGAALGAARQNAVTDGWITLRIHSQFVPADALEGSNIDVDTNAGVVTLSGIVPNEAARAKAVSIAKATDGVKSVNDRMKIGNAESAIDPKSPREAGRSTGRTITDGWVKAMIHGQFIPEKALSDSDVDVHVKNGVVTLTGTVKSEAGRAKAVEIAKGTAGVKSVTETLKIR
jgi:hyperosmotically inducible protein